MKTILLSVCLYLFCIQNGYSQLDLFSIDGVIDLSVEPDGEVDGLEDFSTRIQVPFTMPDGIRSVSTMHCATR